MATTVYSQIQKNKRKTAILMSLFLLLVGAMGYAAGIVAEIPPEGTIMLTAIAAIIMALVSYFAGDKIALATSGAKPVTSAENPYIYRIVENLAITAGLPTPKIYIIEDSSMNAFATGRKPETASVAFTSGIIEGLENEELEAVAAHELSHIKNYDTRLMMIVTVLVGSIILLGDIMWRGRWLTRRRSSNNNSNQAELVIFVIALVFLILSPIIAQLIQLAVSRKREYLADASAVLLTRYPDALESALKKISGQGQAMQNPNGGTAHLFFANPFGPKSKIHTIWSTHPPIAERIKILHEIRGTRA